jgi:acetate kinase
MTNHAMEGLIRNVDNRVVAIMMVSNFDTAFNKDMPKTNVNVG